AVVETESDTWAAGVQPESAERLRRRLPALPDDGVRMRGPGDVARVIDRVGVAGGKRHSQRRQWLQVALLPLEGPVRGRLARISKPNHLPLIVDRLREAARSAKRSQVHDDEAAGPAGNPQPP